MTTVLYCHETRQVAVDSRLLERTRIVTDDQQKWIRRGKHLFFFSGSICDNTKIIEAYFNPAKWVGFHFAAFVVDTEEETIEVIYHSEGKVLIEPVTFDEAIGSGAEFAMAGLDFTHSIREAMEYTKSKDAATGGEIHIYNISQRNFVVE